MDKNKALLQAEAFLNAISWHMRKDGIKMTLVCNRICCTEEMKTFLNG